MPALTVRNTSRAIRKDIQKVKRIRERVAVSAANKSTKKVATATIRGIAKETGIKAQVLRGNKAKGMKARIRHNKYKKRTGKARVWAGLADVPLRKVFSGNSTKGGVKRYSKYVSGSMPGRTAEDVFIATMPRSGEGGAHTGYFVRRPGVGRLGIQEVKLDIKKVGERILRQNGRLIGRREFKKEVDRDLKRRLKRR